MNMALEVNVSTMIIEIKYLKNVFESIPIFTQPLRLGRIWHKVHF